MGFVLGYQGFVLALPAVSVLTPAVIGAVSAGATSRGLVGPPWAPTVTPNMSALNSACLSLFQPIYDIRELTANVPRQLAGWTDRILGGQGRELDAIICRDAALEVLSQTPLILSEIS